METAWTDSSWNPADPFDNQKQFFVKPVHHFHQCFADAPGGLLIKQRWQV
ncbi:hypothetical protein AC96_0304 [Escherichia coli 2-156-04_S4_C2]|nr:hypothetical protein AC96_0304 [Escherichia coli 2-156-04_S4_C2]